MEALFLCEIIASAKKLCYNGVINNENGTLTVN